MQSIKLSELTVVENSRISYKNLNGLMQSIKDQGLINPISICKELNGNKNVIIAGHRRFYSFKKLGYETIPCNFVNIESVKDALLFNLSENIVRKSTTPFEEGRYFDSLIKDHDMTESEISVRLGVTRTYVSMAIKCYKLLPKKYQSKVVYNNLSKIRNGEIPLSVLKSVLDIRREKNINLEKILDLVYKNEIKETEIRFYSTLEAMNPGLTFEDYVKNKNKFTILRMNIVVKTSELEFEIKNGFTKKEILEKVMYGEMEPFTRPL